MKEHREHQLLALGNVLLLMYFVVTGACEVGMVVMMFIVASADLVPQNNRFIQIFRRFGQYSYSIYLIHVAVLIVLDHFYHGSDIIYTMVFLSATCGCSFGAYQLIEKRLGGRLISIFSRENE